MVLLKLWGKFRTERRYNIDFFKGKVVCFWIHTPSAWQFHDANSTLSTQTISNTRSIVEN